MRPEQQMPKPKPLSQIDLLSSPLEDIIPTAQSDQAVQAPPIPPNPEKDALLHTLSHMVVTQTNQAISSNENAIVPLQAQHAALMQAQSALYSELEQIHQLEAAIQTNERILDGAMRDAERVMQDAKGRRRPAVDEFLVCPTVVGSQLYTTVAEERASEETRQALGRLLDAGRIPVDVFVKQSRSLGREVYLKKALGRKIARGMELDERKW
jgi:ESCRT-I complex subunit TSG101